MGILTIYDVGMNIGEDTHYYLARGFNVVAIEAHPQMIEAAKSRFAQEINDGRLILIHGAIADKPGTIRFYICDTMSAWSTTDTFLMEQQKRGGAVFHEVDVPCLQFADIIRQYGMPYYLKVDIEGCDHLCIEALSEFKVRPRLLSVEVDFYNHKKTLEAAEKLGYDNFQIVSQSGVPAQKVPFASIEGNTIDYTFQIGCTGLFGHDLPTKWDSAEGAQDELSGIRLQHKAIGALGRLGGLFGASKPMVSMGRKLLPRTADWYDLHMM